MYYDTSQQKNTARYNDKREINMTLTRSVHWNTKKCGNRLCSKLPKILKCIHKDIYTLTRIPMVKSNY
jgi:hypothetical protein